MGPNTGPPATTGAGGARPNSGHANGASKPRSKTKGGEAKEAKSNENLFRELQLSATEIRAARAAWGDFLAGFPSREEAAEAVWESLFENAPIIQSIFTTPKVVHSMKFLNSLDEMVIQLSNPPGLCAVVELLGFMHLHVEVTMVWAEAFRDSVVELLAIRLPNQFGIEARKAWSTLVDYASEAIFWSRRYSTDRLSTITESWHVARHKAAKEKDKPRAALADASPTSEDRSSKDKSQKGSGTKSQSSSPSKDKDKTPLAHASSNESLESGAESQDGGDDSLKTQTTFFSMFQVNASVMGFKRSANTWMIDVLESFDTMILNLENSSRIQEECDVLALRITKRCAVFDIQLGEFRACMLASLRSSLPKIWTSHHEEAWTWAWDNIARMLGQSLDKPQKQERALAKHFQTLTEDDRYALRKAMYDRFFELAPAGQDYFKQSNTRLHFIADQVMNMTLRIYQMPKKFVSEISALGLRHTAFGVPTDLFAPFVTSSIEVWRQRTDDATVIAALRWSMGLISKILVRTIREGSTVVMKAINTNSTRQLKMAMEVAPRVQRASWLLHVQVGDQHISPLAWAIQTGSLAVADAILKDLLTIRADRKRYYYGAEELFARHSNIVKLLSEDAPTLLPTLLDGLVWRSNRPKNGLRRVNAYLKCMLINSEGKFSDSLKWVSSSGNPAIVSHTIIASMVETLWNGLVLRQFIYSRTWNIACLTVFILCQEMLPDYARESTDSVLLWAFIFLCRIFVYMAGMCRLAAFHLWRVWLWSRNTMKRIIEEIDTDGNGTIDHEEMIEALRRFRHTVKEEIQKALRVLRDEGPGGAEESRKAIANKEKNMYTVISTVLVVLQMLMLCHEPMLWCMNDVGWPTDTCAQSVGSLKYRYSIFSMCAMVVHWLILIDLAVFSTEISAFLLVCGHVLGEVKQFLTALAFLLLIFGSSISIFCRTCPNEGGDYSDMTNAIVSLFAITVGLYQGDYRDIQMDPLLLAAIFLFVLLSVILLLNLLIAQLNRSYEYIYKDMLGFARLNRASLIVEAMGSCSKTRWKKFVEAQCFDDKIEFDEGDLGLPGGIQILEPASHHRVTADSIRRYGGSADENLPWPEERHKSEEEEGEDRLDRIEALLQKTMQQLSTIAKQQMGRGVAGKNSIVSGSLIQDSFESSSDGGSEDMPM